MQMREALRQLVNSLRSRKLIGEALRKTIKPTRPVVAGNKVFFYTGGGKAVKSIGWRGPATVVQINGRQSVLQFSGRFYTRSLDTLRPWTPPHGGVEAAAVAAKKAAQRAEKESTKPPGLEPKATQASESTAQLGDASVPASLYQSVLCTLREHRSLDPEQEARLEVLFGRRFLSAQVDGT